MFSKYEIIQQCKYKITQADIAGQDPDKAGITLALLILSTALFGKKLWDGSDYTSHPLEVMNLSRTESRTKRIIAILHDVIEDSDWTLDDLRTVGFSEREIAGVDAVTKRAGEKYFDFVERCSLNSDGIDVKLADLKHNSDETRNTTGFPSEWNMLKTKAYIVSYNYLVAVKTGAIEPGTPITEFFKKRPEFFDLTLMKTFSSRPVSECIAPAPVISPAHFTL